MPERLQRIAIRGSQHLDGITRGPDLHFRTSATWRLHRIGHVAHDVAPLHGLIEGTMKNGMQVMDRGGRKS